VAEPAQRVGLGVEDVGGPAQPVGALGERRGPVAPERRGRRRELLVDLLFGEGVEALEQLAGRRVRRCDGHARTLRRDAARRSKPTSGSTALTQAAQTGQDLGLVQLLRAAGTGP
jgi:hypothetical protein